MNADELRRLRADITYAMDLRHTYLDREETRWRILETVVSKPFRAFLDERSNQLQVIERDRLAEACRVALPVLMGPGPLHERQADAIIRALDSTTGDERG